MNRLLLAAAAFFRPPPMPGWSASVEALWIRIFGTIKGPLSTQCGHHNSIGFVERFGRSCRDVFVEALEIF